MTLPLKNKKTSVLIGASFFLLFAAFLYKYSSVKLWDFDYWWHISTGKYIVQNCSLPHSDPFSFTNGLSENKNPNPLRESFILKQYWLAQIIFYLIFDSTGTAGIIILRSAILFLTVILVFWGLCRKNVQFYIAFVFTFLTYQATFGFTGERPVLFTILFSPMTFLLLEDYKENKGWRILLLVPLMLVWSNMHGGFVLGDVIILTFLFGETVKELLGRSAYKRNELKRFYVLAIAAVMASFVNPNGATAFIIAFSGKYEMFTNGIIQEYQSPFSLFKNGSMPIKYEYIALTLLFPLLLIFRRAKIDLTHLLLLSGLFYMSIKSFRFTIYYETIGSIIMGRELNILVESLFSSRFSLRFMEKLKTVFALCILLSSIGYLGVLKSEALELKQADWFSIPRGGVDFIERSNLQGRILNEFGTGGYLAWRLYPAKRTFIDTRILNLIVLREYYFMMNAFYSTKQVDGPKYAAADVKKSPLWKRLLDHYNIDIIFINHIDTYGNITRLFLKLIDDDDWVPVYIDRMNIIFVRASGLNKDIMPRYVKTKEEILNSMVFLLSSEAQLKGTPAHMESLGEIFYRMGRLGDSLKAYRYAFEKDHDPAIYEIIKKIEIEMKEKEHSHA